MKIDAQPRPFAAALSLIAIALLALALPALGVAAEDEEGGPPAPTAPELFFSPSPLDFAKVTVGTESTAVYVSVHNTGSVPAPIDKVTVEGPDSGDFKFSAGNCGWLAPGQDCSGWISFAPGSVGPKTAALVAQLKEFPAQSAPLAGTGVSTQLSFSPSTHDFGIQRLYDNGGTDLELTNSGEAPVQLGNLDIVGPDSDSFSTGPSNCWGHWIQPGTSCFFSVGFSPHRVGDLAAAVRASAHGESFTAALTGTGGQAVVGADPDPAEFGATTVGMAGAPHTVVLTNTGNLAANYFIGIVSGGDAGSFRLLTESCSGAPIEPEASCSAQVLFTPDGAGPKQAKLSFFGDAEGGTQVTLDGEGVDAVATIAPAGFDFGTQDAGTRSAPRPLPSATAARLRCGSIASRSPASTSTSSPSPATSAAAPPSLPETLVRCGSVSPPTVLAPGRRSCGSAVPPRPSPRRSAAPR